MITNWFELLDYLFMALAVWRFSYMLVAEDGNMGVAYIVRLMGNKPKNEGVSRFEAWKRSLTKPSGITPTVITNNFGKMLSCIWCTTVTVGIVWVLAYHFFGTNTVYQLWTLSWAIAALAIMINDFKFSQ